MPHRAGLGAAERPSRLGAWYQAIHDVHLDSKVEANARFDWANGKSHMRSRFAVVEAKREITWTGVAYGAKAVHRHVLKPAEGGATRVFRGVDGRTLARAVLQ
jgi:hypothetical protein